MTYDTTNNQGQSFEGVPVLPEKASGMAVAALVLGILGLCCCGIFAGIPALVVGWMENGKINRGESSSKGKGFAVAGMILGIISLLLGCLQIIWIVFWGGLGVLQGLAGSH